MKVTIERAVAHLNKAFARACVAEVTPLDHKATAILAHDILHSDMVLSDGAVSAVLLAGRVKALDELMNGSYPGIPHECDQDVNCVTRTEVRNHVLRGVRIEVWEVLQGCLFCADHCVRYCTENPNSEFRLRPEEVPEMMERCVNSGVVHSDGCDDTASVRSSGASG